MLTKAGLSPQVRQRVRDFGPAIQRLQRVARLGDFDIDTHAAFLVGEAFASDTGWNIMSRLSDTDLLEVIRERVVEITPPAPQGGALHGEEQELERKVA